MENIKVTKVKFFPAPKATGDDRGGRYLGYASVHLLIAETLSMTINQIMIVRGDRIPWFCSSPGRATAGGRRFETVYFETPKIWQGILDSVDSTFRKWLRMHDALDEVVNGGPIPSAASVFEDDLTGEGPTRSYPRALGSPSSPTGREWAMRAEEPQE